MRCARIGAVVAATLFACAVLAPAVTAPPVRAFTSWQHDGATGCSCHQNGQPTDASCTVCHSGFQSYPELTCWSCHYPGQDTRPFWTEVTPTPTPTPTETPTSTPTPTASPTETPTPTASPTETPTPTASPTETPTPTASPTDTPTPTASPTSAPCSQECHLYSSTDKAYTIPFTHGESPHVGSTPQCLGCHERSPGIADSGSSPHHSGQTTGFADCGACHPTPQKHARKVTCTRCHTKAVDFHLYEASSPGYRTCGSCHKMRHAKKRVSTRKCASCHRGTSGRAVQHSARITKRYACGACHKQKLHARAVSKRVKSCRTCHRGKFHAAQRIPAKSTCKRCHVVKLRHDNGYPCFLCHRPAIHDRRPSPVNT